MFTERPSVGLDVHARSVRAAAIDTFAGEVIERTISPRTDQVVAFLYELAGEHGPVLVTYEAGPTGYGLARALDSVGQRCQVAAPSKQSARSGIESRPMPATRCCWRGWPLTTTSSRSRSRPCLRSRRGTWSGPMRMPG